MEFRVFIAQINPTSGDIKGNAALIKEAIRKGSEEASHLVVLPEMCLTGYCLDEKLLFNLRFLRQNKEVLFQEIAPACDGISAIVGFVDFEEGRSGPDYGPIRYNAAAVIENGKVIQIVHKRLLPSYRYFDDKRYFSPGTEVEPAKISVGDGSLSIGVLICEDLWDEKYEFKPCRVYKEKGVEYLFCINASPFVCSGPGRDGKRSVRERLIRQQVDRYGVPIIWVNTVGIGDKGKNVIPFDGLSTAHDRKGSLCACLASFAADQQTVVFSDGEAARVARPTFGREQEIYDALVMGVRDYYDKIGIFNGVLEAISGGIDSALGAAIAFEAMGPELLTLYNLPSKYNTQTTQDAAASLAENFGVAYRVIPIQDLVDRAILDFETYLHPIRQSITLENLQARIRGLIMMAESNDQDALLLTNGNETEIALGYATLYGDMVGGLAVIGDLPKPDVYGVARYVNQRWGESRIPEEIFDIPASAELDEGQVDPFDYDVVGPIVSDFIEAGLSPDELVSLFEKKELDLERYRSVSGEDLYSRYTKDSFREQTQRLYRLLNQSAYKRMQAAPIIAVSQRAFGFDLRESIINGWNG